MYFNMIFNDFGSANQDANVNISLFRILAMPVTNPFLVSKK